ncbi:MAG: PAS domain-containing protein [Bacilli bacterium]
MFDRPLTVIGRSVELCHPPKSVHVVNEIVENFRAGQGALPEEGFFLDADSHRR